MERGSISLLPVVAKIESTRNNDSARYKDADSNGKFNQELELGTGVRNRNTIEFPGVGKHLNNPDFKPVEFDGFRKLIRAQQFHRYIRFLPSPGHRPVCPVLHRFDS